ncbi:fumarylacetoacetate hydrolase family protein [Chryseobacterium fluminis]|uniref:fumarylacetoacetate hydrolase family protein n=1 Tax=Chryseobacterium fluminis TaxID=2983606 RepID=UPI002257E147|nr:fumarylacetoacetate hydrolase family protein [Chryseobacterium sp. MMS21-Ot14]UZT96024.1 fumarylacetoacetate hydrolase family protein [Chryseobacterium sp. MMS21-Ot14]
MKLLMFTSGSSEPKFGAFVRGKIIDLNEIANLAGLSLPTSLQESLKSAAGLSDAEKVIQYSEEHWDDLPEYTIWNENQIQWLPIISSPEKIICVGLNYKHHIMEMNREMPKAPVLFAKMATTLNGHKQPVPYADVSDSLDFEAELAVVIGKKGKNIKKQNAMEYVVGYSCFNDVTVREYQFRTVQWMQGKNFDGHGPIGPMLVTPNEIKDLSSSKILLRLNGEIMQESFIGDLIFDVPTLIEVISAIMTLNPGDIIATGTPSGVGFGRNPKVFMQRGDVVEVEITDVGILENTIK